jgi:hypothetical protein
MYDLRAHAKELLGVFERYCKERPDIVANQHGLKCARELVRLIEADCPDQAALDALHAELAVRLPDAGSAWIDLQLNFNQCFRK